MPWTTKLRNLFFHSAKPFDGTGAPASPGAVQLPELAATGHKFGHVDRPELGASNAHVRIQGESEASVVIRSNPSTDDVLNKVDQAWFESDAASNDEAIREIDAEAARHGLVRVNEYWLQKHTVPDGRIVRRGFCYRPEESQLLQRLEERRASQPKGGSSGVLMRDLRAEGR